MTDFLDLEFPEPSVPHMSNGVGSDDLALDLVESWFRSQTKMQERFGKVFRQSIDEVLDGQRTSRFDIYAASVTKTERTYLGTKVEIIFQDEFQLHRGRRMDYLVAGHEVDAKFSMIALFRQAIPREAMGHICLIMYASDKKECFSVGLVRVTPAILNPSDNQDSKKTISFAGRAHVRWLVREGRLPNNQLLHMPEHILQAIFDRRLSKQERVNTLFELVQGEMINRRTLVTVAQQQDGPKRARDARLALCDQGILILGYRDGHPEIARDLGLPVPKQSEWISIRVIPRPQTDRRPAAMIRGSYYVVARPDEEPCAIQARYGTGE